jgi:hypothetical protein
MQGASISERMTIFDLNIPYVSKERIYVAITRARSLKIYKYLFILKER